MKFIRLSVICITLLLFSNLKSNAQYRKGIGGHFGNWMGVTYKQYMDVNADQSIEILGIKDNTIWRATAIYAWNKSVRLPGMQVSGLNWHYGLGIHVGREDQSTGTADQKRIEYGFDGQIGVELLWGELPFSIGVDVNPFYSFGNEYTGTPIAGGLILRYLIQK